MILPHLMEDSDRRRGEDEYDFDKNCDEVAASRGLVVVLPKANQLQIDIDSESAFAEFERRYRGIETEWLVKREARISASGLPHRHIYLTFQDRTFGNIERVMMQAALGDDSVRVFLNMMRIERNVPNPSRLFEKPPVTE